MAYSIATEVSVWQNSAMTKGEKAKGYREQLGLSTVALAKLAKVNKETVNRMELGASLTLRKVTAIAVALGFDSYEAFATAPDPPNAGNVGDLSKLGRDSTTPKQTQPGGTDGTDSGRLAEARLEKYGKGFYEALRKVDDYNLSLAAALFDLEAHAAKLLGRQAPSLGRAASSRPRKR